MSRCVVVATMTVRLAELEAFRAFEQRAVRVMARHGGAIERTVVAPGVAEGTVREVHVVVFADEAAFAAYRADPELALASPLRERSVERTEVVVGTDGPRYG
jgi:hypothetical protein